MGKLIEGIKRLGPFSCIQLELTSASPEMTDLAEIVDISKIPINEVIEVHTDYAKINILKYSPNRITISATRRCEGILGRY